MATHTALTAVETRYIRWIYSILYSKQQHIYGYICWECNSNMESSNSKSQQQNRALAVYRKTITLTWDYGAIIRHLHHFLSNQIHKKPHKKTGGKKPITHKTYARKPQVIWNLAFNTRLNSGIIKNTSYLIFPFGSLSWILHLMTWYTRLK